MGRLVGTLVVFGAVLVLGVVLFSYLVLPALIESRLAASVREGYGLEEEPLVDVSSSFPPEILLGRIDRIGIQINRLTQEGIELRDVRITLENVDASLGNLLGGGSFDMEREVEAVSLVAEAPEASINEYLRENDLGLEGGQIDVRPQEVVYQSEDAFFGLPAAVGLDLQASGPRTVEVVPQGATVAGLELPFFLTRSLASGGRTLTLSELPLGVELTSVEPSSEEALVVRAER